MGKTLIIITGLLLAAVLCTAGCIEAPSDPIVGDWVSETDGSVTYAVFENGGAGFFAADKDSVLTLEWKANGDKTYTFLFADGTTKTAVLDAEHGLMTIGGVEYQKYPSELSGALVGGKVLGMLVEGWKYESVSYNPSLKSRAGVTPD